jgi:hypothetical protein
MNNNRFQEIMIISIIIILSILFYLTYSVQQLISPSQVSVPLTQSQGLVGNWESLFEDGLGYSLRISELNNEQFLGEIYSHNQNGSVEKELEIKISDKGAGLAEITWPNGDVNTATWGRRDANTSNDMSAEWNGDIWLECVGYLKWATSRAECNFFLAK